MGKRHVEQPGRLAHLPIQVGFDLCTGLELIPEQVDLVQDHDRPRHPALHVTLPDLQIALRDTGLGGQEEQDRVAVRDHAHGQLRLGAEGIQSGRVEDDQPALEQRVGEVDDGVPPCGDVDAGQALSHHGGGVEVAIGQQPELVRFLKGHALGLGEHAEGLHHGVEVLEIQADLHPFDRPVLEGDDAFAAGPCLDRQQADVGFLGGVMEQLGRAHRGSADAGGQQPLLEAREEHGIDELRLATRVFREEGEDHPVVAQALRQVVEAQGALDVDLTAGIQPCMVGLDAGAQLFPPLAVAGDQTFQLVDDATHAPFSLPRSAAPAPDIRIIF